jgi:hypothetical protein
MINHPFANCSFRLRVCFSSVTVHEFAIPGVPPADGAVVAVPVCPSAELLTRSSTTMGVGPSKKQKDAKKQKDESLYAELSGLTDFPPIRILLNEHVTSATVDSLKDSEGMTYDV